MRLPTKPRPVCRAVVFALALAMALAASPVRAEEPFAADAISLTKGKSMVLDSVEPIKRISLADPSVADILLLSPYQIYLTGKKTGATNLTLWGLSGGVSRVYDLTVSPDTAALKEMLHKLLPDERNIRVMTADESITLSGTVSSARSLDVALDTAELFAPEKVANMLSVGGVHQVMLEVKVAEMHRTVLERIGIDLNYYMNGDFVFTLMNDLFALDNKGPLPINAPGAVANGAIEAGSMRVNPGRNGMFRLHQGTRTLTGFMDVLKQNGLIKVLAEPTLICRSGEEAQFLAGGEIPVPVPEGLGTVAIEYKEYGVALAFSPTVVSGERISLKVQPEVSELDYTNAVTVSGFTIPALTTRRTATTVELGDGQSFAIAGLLQDEVRETAKKYPLLGDIPMLGALFRSNQFQKAETELVIIVTPHLAKPLDMAEQSLPTDHYVEPTEFEFFMMGKMEGEGKPASASIRPSAVRQRRDDNAPGKPASGMEGDFGHILE